ncbi:MAG: hypothetical protein K6G89_05375 [Clostridia bacterium]|nr:hypothetical protein [Clostridia bacterium]
MFYIIVGSIIAFLGFTTGIVLAATLSNFWICVYVWIGTFLYALIYIGIGHIVRNQNDMKRDIIAIKKAIRENIGLSVATKNDIQSISNAKDKSNGKSSVLDEIPEPETVREKSPVENIAVEIPKICQSCGKEFRGEECPYCGSNMICCPECGVVQKSDRLVCWSCGKRFVK